MADHEGAKVLETRKQMTSLSSTTLFVRNLPFSIDKKELEKIFSEVGPVKRCFVVKDKSNPEKCRGFGYVTFALKEDANEAQDKIREINGRRLYICFSNKKPRHKDRGAANGNTDEIKSSDTVENGETENKEMPEKSDRSTTVKRAKNKPKSKRSSAINDDGRTVVLSGFPATFNMKQIKKVCKRQGDVERFILPIEKEQEPTAHAVYKLHKDARKAVLSLDGKTVKGAILKVALRSKSNKHVSQRSLKKSRLIVRNLPFKCSKEMLNAAFSNFGNISEIVVPTKMAGKSKKKLGFAFVQFQNVFDAARALEGMNGQSIKGRPIAVDWTVPKKKYELMKVSEDAVENGDDESGIEISKENKKGDRTSDDNIDIDNSIIGDDDKNIDSDNDTNDNIDGGDDTDDNIDDGDDTDDNIDDDIEDIDDDAPVKKKRKLRDAREGKTVFIRNLPFDATVEEIVGLLVEFGEVDYCKIVMDSVTEHSRGSAFLKFKEKESTDNCLRKYGEEHETSEDLMMRKRPLSVTLAVTQGKVPQLLAERDVTKKAPRDKRNLYLAKEGVVDPRSDAAATLSKSDLRKRQKAEEEKKTKLKLPHYVVSKTRLCLRNLPLNVDDAKLAEVLRSACEGKPKIVRKVKIMRNVERLDRDGNARSKGFAFAEFTNHGDALEVLRATNNNPAIFGAARRPIVEFAIENGLVLKRLEQRTNRNIERTKQEQSKQDGAAATLKGGKRKHRPKGDVKRNTRKTMDENAHVRTTQNNDGGSFKTKYDTRNKNNKLRARQNTDFNLAEVASKVEREIPKPRTKHKRRENVDKEEQKFNDIVEKYKTKLFGENSKLLKDSRWFNS